MLNAFKSLKPIPPSDLGVQRLSQDVHAIFLSLPFCPHQNWLIKEFNSQHKEFESLKQLIVYVVVTWATALIRISLPTVESNLPFHPTIRLPQ